MAPETRPNEPAGHSVQSAVPGTSAKRPAEQFAQDDAFALKDVWPLWQAKQPVAPGCWEK